jgi:hypothetical protein
VPSSWGDSVRVTYLFNNRNQSDSGNGGLLKIYSTPYEFSQNSGEAPWTATGGSTVGSEPGVIHDGTIRAYKLEHTVNFATVSPRRTYRYVECQRRSSEDQHNGTVYLAAIILTAL